MRFPRLLSVLSCILFSGMLYAGTKPGKTGNPSQVKNLINHKDWSFVENKGQLADENGQPQTDIKYYGRQGGVYLYCKPGTLSFVFTKTEKEPDQISEATGTSVLSPAGGGRGWNDSKSHQPAKIFTSRADLILLNANPNAQITATDQQTYYENFYLAHITEKSGQAGEQGITNVHTFKTLIYKNIYPNIDMVIHAKEQGIKYEFVVNPGGKVSDIQMQWNGLDKMEMTENGGIKYSTSLGMMEEGKPVSFQGGERVKSSFRKTNSLLAFKVKNYDRKKELVIDPSLAWATYFGASGSEQSESIVADSINNIFIGGNTSSTSGIATAGAYQTTCTTGGAMFIAKFSSSGNRLWATYYGSSPDYAYGITLDATNNIYTAGNAGSTSGLATSGTYKTTNSGGGDIFVAKFNSSGFKSWATYFGGSSLEYFRGISFTHSGGVIISGYTNSTSGIATAGSFQTSFGGGTQDAFLAKFSSSGTLDWSTYFGGSSYDEGFGIVTDQVGNFYWTGHSLSSSGIASTGAFQTSCVAGDAFVAKFSASGTRIWSTYFGGNKSDYGHEITLVENGYLCITGETTSTSNLATNGASKTSNSGGNDAFLAKFSTSGSRIWSTYLGGSNADYGRGIASDTTGNIYICGPTSSTNGIATSGAFKTQPDDMYLAKFSKSGYLFWSTYLGGNLDDTYGSITTGKSGSIYIGGTTKSTSGIATSGAFQTSFSGSDDIFLLKFNSISDDAGILSIINPNSSVCPGPIPVSVLLDNYGKNELNSVIIHYSVNGIQQTPYYWKGKIQSDSSAIVVIDTFTFFSGKDTISVWTSSPNGKTDSLINNDSAYSIIIFKNAPVMNTGGNYLICNGGSYSLGGSATPNTFYSWTSKPAGFTSTISNPLVSPTITTTYFLKETLATSGCASIDSVIVTVGPQPSSSFTVNTSSQCLSFNSFSLTDKTTIPSGSISSWKWSFGDLGTSTSQNPTHIYSTAGTFTVKLVATSNNGCKDSTTKTVTVYPQPSTSFTISNAAQCLTSNSFTFTDKSTISSGSVSSWAWNFGDLATSTLQSPSHSYTAAGTYTIKLVITSNNGCKDSTTKTVTVYPQSSVGFTISNAAQCLSTNSFSFTDNTTVSSGSISSWAWDFGDTKSSTIQSPSHSYTSAGTYTVKLTVTTNNGCTDNISKSVTVYPQPASTFTINSAGQCLTGNSFSFTDNSTVSSGSISTWAWDFGDTKSSTSQSPSHTYTGAGTYTVKLTITTNNGCTDNISKTVTVYPQPVSAFAINSNAQCLSTNSFAFTDNSTISSGSISTWAWDFGDSKSSTSQSPSHTYTAAGTYTVKLTVTTNNGCTDNISKTVTVYPQPVSTFSINTAGQCLTGNSFTFTDNSTVSSGTISTWAWDFGDTKSSTAQSPSHIYTSSGTYTVKLTVTTNNGCIDNISKTITVYPQPVSSFTIANAAQCLTGNSFAFTDNSTVSSGSVTTWAWTFGDAGSSTTQNPSHSYTSAGIDTVKLIVTTNNGCTDKSAKTVTMFPKPGAGFTVNTAAQCFPGNSFTFTDISTVTTGTVHAWAWDFGDASSATSQNPVHSYTNPGTYKILLTVTTDNGCTDTLSHFITVFPKLTTAFNINAATQCLTGNSFTFTDNSLVSAGSISIWHYDFGDGGNASTQNAAHTYSTSGTYSVKLKIKSDKGCYDSISHVVTVNAMPAANAGSNQTICQGISANIGASPVSGNTYEWISKPSGFTSTLSNPSTTPLTTTNYYLTETISATGCKKSDSLIITVNPLPLAIAGVDKTICPGNGVTLGALKTTGHTYSWISSPSGFTSTISSPSVHPAASTIYSLTETITATGCSKTNSTTITIDTACKGYLTLEMDSAMNTFDTLKVKVIIHNAKKVYSLYSRLEINPNIFKLVSSKPGNFLGTSIINTPAIMNAGYIDFGITKTGSQPGANGDGLFYSFTLVVKDSFPTVDIKSLFTLDSLIAYDNTGSHINIYDSAIKSVNVHSRVFVWPGDLNNDKKVDVSDILPIGYFYNAKGPKRTGASLSWAAQPAPFWGYDKSTKSKKGWAVFADADGNGIVGLADQAAIGLNLSKSHLKQNQYTEPVLPAQKAGDPDLNAAFADTFILNTTLPKTVTIPVNIGSTTTPVKNLNGVAFNLFFNPKYMDASSVKFDYTGSIFGAENADFIKQEDVDVANGRISIGLTRFNDATLNGNGNMVNLTFTIPASAPDGYFKLSAIVIQATDSNGKDIGINSSVDSVRIGKKTGIEMVKHGNINALNIYPNPFQANTTVQYNLLKSSPIKIALFDITGKEVCTVINENKAAGNYQVDINAEKYKLNPGIYLLKFMVGDELVTRRLIKF